MGAQPKQSVNSQIEQMRISVNALTSVVRSRLSSFMGYSHEGNRDLYKQFGYERNLRVGDLQAMYERGDVANRIVRAYPQATWREMPIIRDDAGDSVEKTDKRGKKNPHYSPFADAFQQLAHKHKIIRFLERADRLSSIGRYGVLVLGLNDGQTPDQPLRAGNAPLLYLRPYSEANVTISRWDTNALSPRFGLPELYRVENSPVDGGPVGPTTHMAIHYSRVIHVSEFLESDEIYGQPRLKAIFNRLMDLEKVVGGGAETFWLVANRGLAVSADKDARLSEESKKDIKDQMEEFANQLRRTLVLQGMTAQSIGSDTPDPEPYVNGILDLIAGASGVPKRILLGTERGELASSQDENNWSLRIEERRKNFAAPAMLEPLVQKLIDTGNLPKPEGRFYAEWPKHVGLDPAQAATIAAQKASAIATYANSAASEQVVPIQEFRRDILGMDPESEYEVPEEEPINEDDPNLVDDPAADDAGKGDADDEGDAKPEREPDVNASRPRTLYVSRRVLNVGPIKKWAMEQGFTDVQADLHVTVVYSRKALDWMTVPQDYAIGPDYDGRLMVPPGGPRVVEEIGPGRYEMVEGKPTKVGQAVALLFTNSDLSWRHDRIVSAGATHDFGDYQPHITITYSAPEGLDLDKVEPYQGAIALGPEIFEEIDDE